MTQQKKPKPCGPWRHRRTGAWRQNVNVNCALKAGRGCADAWPWIERVTKDPSRTVKARFTGKQGQRLARYMNEWLLESQHTTKHRAYRKLHDMSFYHSLFIRCHSVFNKRSLVDVYVFPSAWHTRKRSRQSPAGQIEEFAIFGLADNLAQKQAAENAQSGQLFGPAQTLQTLYCMHFITFIIRDQKIKGIIHHDLPHPHPAPQPRPSVPESPAASKTSTYPAHFRPSHRRS
jgi:hypothetical protein